MNPELSLAAMGSLHDLHEFHEGDRVEEMHADEAVSPFGCRGHGGDREARRVGREDRVLGTHCVELFPQAVLELEIFGDRLEDDVAVLEVVDARRERQAPQRVVAVLRGHLLLFHELGQGFLDGRLALVVECVRNVPDDRFVPRGRGDLCDAPPHQPATQHADLLYVCHDLSECRM
jgi:hypothetical protein